MNLFQAAVYFDRTTCSDPYGVEPSIKGQLDPFTMFTVDGARIKRRVLTTGPDVPMMSRSTIQIGKQVYLVGDETDDEWEGAPLRTNYVLVGADWLAEIKTVAEALEGETGHECYVSRAWTSSKTDSRESAEAFSHYQLSFAAGEPIQKRTIAEFDGELYYIFEVRKSLSGLTDAVSVELEAPARTQVRTIRREYDAIRDEYVETVSDPVPAIMMRWQDGFQYLTEHSTDFVRGDSIAFVLPNTQVKTNDVIEISSTRWKILSIIGEGGALSLHLRRA